jgi:hypothetical protein
MSILLLDGLPEEYEGVRISADFRNMIQVDMILHDAGLSKTEKTFAALGQLYPDIPEDINHAARGLAWFYLRGDAGAGRTDAKKARRKAFDFEQDAPLIYAAFHATYGINLATVEFLHWWEFMALFEGLPETTLIQRVIYWRTADLNDLPKQEKAHVRKMRGQFALKEPERAAMGVEELEQQTKDAARRRFAEARAATHGQRKGAADEAE